MPLFKCPDCGVIENTALGDFWGRGLDKLPPRCSQCATGKWHDRFPRRTPEELGYVELAHGGGSGVPFYGPADGSWGEVRKPTP